MNPSIPEIDIKDYNYNLPEERIAQYPVKDRDKSKLLLYKNGIITSDQFSRLPDYIPGDSLLVFNNTRVIRARLLFRKESGAIVEILCLEPVNPAGYEMSFGSKQPVEWKCLIGNLKKWKGGSLSLEYVHSGKTGRIYAERICTIGEAWKVLFRWDRNELTFGEVIEAAGHIPLPPYIKREDEEADENSYQTVYSRINGSIAAPTAGLHFTGKVLNDLKQKGITSTELTLHVGAGTFRPVRAGRISDHEMHTEHFVAGRETLELLIRHAGRITAVGTTTVRSLESLYHIGVGIADKKAVAENNFFVNQWSAYGRGSDITLQDSMSAILDYMDASGIESINASTRILIVPGYKFRMINGLITNFHQPQSTLLLLISAWIGDDWKKVYGFALKNNFRFLSYGDSSFLAGSD